eukprot:gene15970-22101_t
MKLLTHNFLTCHIRGVKNAYPFIIEAAKVETKDADYDPDFLRHIFPRIHWPAFLEGATALGCREGLPQESPNTEMLQDDSFLKAFHHALLEVCVEDGALVCPETGRKFPVNKGIPNLLLNEDEA